MNRLRSLCLAALLATAAPPLLLAQDTPGKPLLDVTTKGDLSKKGIATETPNEVSFEPSADGVVVSITPGKAGYPGIVITPETGSAWDLGKFGHISARITNISDQNISVALRVDNSGGGPEPWNTEVVYFKGNETKDVKVIFGHSYGKASYQLDSSRVVKLLLFSGKPKQPVSWRLESLVAGGEAGEKPPTKPDAVHTAPKAGGLVLGKGGLEAKMFKTGGNAAVKEVSDQGWKVEFAKKGQFAELKPAQGTWDWREGLQAEVKIRNTGSSKGTPIFVLVSGDKRSEKISAPAPLASGSEADLILPFAGSTAWNSAEKESGSRFGSHKVTAIVMTSDLESGSQSYEITGIKISLPPAPKLPEWLGKRPPVEGNWKVTLDDEFNGTEVDEKVWSIYGSNFWDKKTTHFSKNNVIVKDGTVTMRVTKETGHHNDDPKEYTSNYATGFLESYGKFVQKYGYFEARTKLTASPGVWPAFWLMPDRGGDDPQWKRASTENGGMEFDIMEHLSGWGVYRYNIAMHWDGYGKGHKSIGTSSIYIQPDKDGYITTGLLWTPGSAVFYCNGQEVGRHEDPRVSNVQSDIMFTLPMGGWDNLPMDDSKLPAEFVIDYVRVWQRADLAK